MGAYNKFRAVKDDCDAGHLHDSKMEARRCSDLCAQLAVGAITDLAQQPAFVVEINGTTVCKYTADFSYRMPSGLAIVEDVKGMPTPIFNLKRRLVEAAYPGVVITVYPPKKRKARKVKAK